MGRPTKDPYQSLPEHRKALVWTHVWDNEDGETVCCLLCSPKIVNMRIKEAYTKNPRVHLASFHKKWKEVEKEEKEKQAEKEKANKSAEKTSQPKINAEFCSSLPISDLEIPNK